MEIYNSRDVKKNKKAVPNADSIFLVQYDEDGNEKVIKSYYLED